jgi:hypothetical protein
MNLLEETQLLTVAEVARRRQQSERTVRDKIASGQLPRRQDRHWPASADPRRPAELETWLAASHITPAERRVPPALIAARKAKTTNGSNHEAPALFWRAPSSTPAQVSAKKTPRNAVKVCKHCGQRKEPGKFRRSRRNRDGLSSWCGNCHNEATRRWREANKERINAARRVVPRFVYDAESRSTVPNPDPRPKSKVR